jgi:uncharacterized membrane protein
MMIALLFLFYFSIPLALQWAGARFAWIEKVGVVTLCYIAGILVGNLPGYQVPEAAATPLMQVAVLLSIPLLLFSSDFGVWRRMGTVLTLSFFCCVISVALAVVAGTFLFKNSIADAWRLGSMMMGIYTGGTPNLTAIGMSLGVSTESLIVLNGAEMLCGAIWLLFLLSVAKPVLQKFLKAAPAPVQEVQFGLDEKIYPKTSVVALLISLAIAAGAIGLSYLLFSKEDLIAISILLLVTTLGIAGSRISYVRQLKGSFGLGNYFLLIFCVAVGSLADVHKIFGAAPAIFGFVACIMATTIMLHLLLSRIFKIDVDTFIIASTAGLYGPPFIAPVAKAIRNPYLIPVGIALGLLGLAIGNYCGVAISNLLYLL